MLVHSPDGWDWIKLKPGVSSHVGGRGSSTWTIFYFRRHVSRKLGSEVGKLGLELVLIWDTGFVCGGLTFYTTMLAAQIFVL